MSFFTFVAEVLDQTEEQYRSLLIARVVITNERVSLSKQSLTRSIWLSLDIHATTNYDLCDIGVDEYMVSRTALYDPDEVFDENGRNALQSSTYEPGHKNE
jgi:hypothetical protein